MRAITVDKVNITPGKILCVGKNYLAHLREMGGSRPMPEPTIFMKPNSAIVSGANEVAIPAAHGVLHHEVELCFVISRTLSRASEQEAGDSISGWGVGIDFTLRDIQSAAKKAGGPWTISKGFDCAAVFGEFVTTGSDFDPLALDIKLSLNGNIRQSANTGQMIFSPAEVVSFVSRFMTIDAGDLFMTGTPEGVGEVKDGDKIDAEISGLPPLKFAILRP
ncbi:MAG: fumarylacetoacetate hydrolase family protein [candidate division Zixibacteria bacterium]|nr:fumarylacetoacetate hydrolase family protein [candidate division Zixibacteria bacterium]MBU1470431.1 fumarylacetoacetate hydrolase family protein [candidate division Zixibacteria bacterium]MBU2625815.1 fumarylacetoacetate hydrolase family protein [candidate division Zixibacteria bacterium]